MQFSKVNLLSEGKFLLHGIEKSDNSNYCNFTLSIRCYENELLQGSAYFEIDETKYYPIYGSWKNNSILFIINYRNINYIYKGEIQNSILKGICWNARYLYNESNDSNRGKFNCKIISQ